MLLFIAAEALAESAATFPAGGASLYAGMGVYSFRKLRIDSDPEQTDTLYRDVTARAELHGAVGATDRLMLSASLPLVYSTVLQPEICTGGPFPCAPILTVGTASLAARYQILDRGIDLTVGLTLSSSSWNARTRGHYNTVGEATTDLGPSLYIGDRYPLGAGGLSWVVSAGYTLRNTFYDASGSSPDDDVRSAAEISGQAGPFMLTSGLSTYQRLGGIEVASLLGTDDRWAVADYDNVSAHAKLSIALRDTLGLHLSASHVLWVRNGPPDAFDLTVGLHRWFAPNQ